MKLKLQLLTIILAFTGLNARSQTLYNTTWKVDTTTGAFFIYFQFDTDTLKYSGDNVNYFVSSTFKENGNNFSIYDIHINSACGTDTGKYTFAIENDTLKFTLVSDSCASRAYIQTSYIWTELVTGIQTPGSTPSILVYPNPISDGIVHLTLPDSRGLNMVSVYSMDGKKVFEENISGSSNPEINLKNLSRGVYILKTNSNEKQYMQKLIIE